VAIGFPEIFGKGSHHHPHRTAAPPPPQHIIRRCTLLPMVMVLLGLFGVVLLVLLGVPAAADIAAPPRQLLLRCPTASEHGFVTPGYASLCVCRNPALPFCTGPNSEAEHTGCIRLQARRADGAQAPLQARQAFNDEEQVFYEGFHPLRCASCRCAEDLATPRSLERSLQRHALVQSHMRAGLRPMKALIYECEGSQLCGGTGACVCVCLRVSDGCVCVCLRVCLSASVSVSLGVSDAYL
jgi:hypothetical protein